MSWAHLPERSGRADVLAGDDFKNSGVILGQTMGGATAPLPPE
jgi:hypothetical protein